VSAEQQTVGVYWEIVYFALNNIDTQKQDSSKKWVNNIKRTNGSTKKNRTLMSKKSLRAAINNKV